MNNIINFDYLQKKRKGGGTMKALREDIKKETMIKIEDLTQKLLIDTDFNKSPYVDVVSLVKKDGFIVKTQTMDIDTTGCIFVNDDDKIKERVIIVNTIFDNPDNETDVIFKKSRFITAHEYGHFMLHKKKGKPIYAHRDSRERTIPEELEADYFARSILMPIKQFKLYCKVLNEIGTSDEKFNIEVLSQLFKVTKNKVKKRMEDILTLS